LLKVKKKKSFGFSLEKKKRQKRTLQIFFLKNNIIQCKFSDIHSFGEMPGKFPVFFLVIHFSGIFSVFPVARHPGARANIKTSKDENEPQGERF